MKTVAAMLAICVMLLLGTMGCSKEEPPPPPPKEPPKIKIVKPVKVQEPEKQKAPIPGEQEKEETPVKEAEEGKVAVVGEIPKKETGEVKPAGVEEKPAQRQETTTEEEETVDKDTERYYIVKKGESLYDVASREDVYGNKLKWPVLYRCNIDTLGGLKTEGDVVERALPEGSKLRIIGPDNVEENLEKRPNKRWVVNVLSTTTNEKVVPITMTLIKNGHAAYLSRTTIKGKMWTRLRVGFFTSKAEADAQRERIKDLLHLGDPWSVKLGPMEFAEFAGY